MKKQAAAVAAGLALAAGLSGCAMFNRGTLHYNRTTTIGRELIDLKEARDKGAVTEAEYAKVKEEILAGGPLKVDAGMKHGRKPDGKHGDRHGDNACKD